MPSPILAQITLSTADKHVQELCRKANTRVTLHHSLDGRVMLRLVNHRSASPSFNSHAELSAYAQEMLCGFVSREL